MRHRVALIVNLITHKSTKMKNATQFSGAIISALCLLLILGCSDQEESQGLEYEESLAQTREIFAEHVQGHYNADAEAAVDMYGENFKFYGPDNQSLTSRDEVEKVYIELYESVEIEELIYQYEDFDVTGNTAIEMGHLSLTIKPKGMEEDTLITSKERYLAIWEHDEAEGWKVTKVITVAYD